MNIEQPRRCSAKPNGAAFQQRTARGDRAVGLVEQER
jgi:hypothetical protein